MKTLLCVEDEISLLENNRRFFESKGFCVLTAENLEQARQILASSKPDAIVLDIMLPDGNGLDLLSELRKNGSMIPVVMLTAWGEPSHVARGLEMGANEYVSKPFDYDVLLARINTMFRNIEQIPDTIGKGRLEIKPASMIALIDGKDIMLSPKEYSLLLLLTQHKGSFLSAEFIYESVWKMDLLGDKNALQTAVSKLRQKLKPAGYTILTQRERGYALSEIQH